MSNYATRAEPGAFFEVTDGEFDDCVFAVELVRSDGVQVGVGDEGMVAPVGPEALLGCVGATDERLAELLPENLAVELGQIVALCREGLVALSVEASLAAAAPSSNAANYTNAAT